MLVTPPIPLTVDSFSFPPPPRSASFFWNKCLRCKSWALSKLTERLSSSALPNGPVGDPSASGGGLSKSPPAFASPTTSPPPSVPRHHTTALGLNLNGSGKVSASIPGSVAAAVAAGLPIGGGGANTGRFGLQTAGGAGGGLGEEDEWQVGGWWRHCWGGGGVVTSRGRRGTSKISSNYSFKNIYIERGQGNIRFPCSADHEQDWQPYPVDLYSCYMCDHTYRHVNMLKFRASERETPKPEKNVKPTFPVENRVRRIFWGVRYIGVTPARPPRTQGRFYPLEKVPRVPTIMRPKKIPEVAPSFVVLSWCVAMPWTANLLRFFRGRYMC